MMKKTNKLKNEISKTSFIYDLKVSDSYNMGMGMSIYIYIYIINLTLLLIHLI